MPSLIDIAHAILKADDFYEQKHQLIFAAQIALHRASRVIDPITLKDELQRRGEFEVIGGHEYIAWLVDAVPTPANIEYHARIVHERAALRELAHIVRDGKNTITEISERLLERIARLPARADQSLILRLLMDGEPPLPPAIHTDQFLLAGDINFLCGHGDAGKSTIMFMTAVCTVLGRPVFGTRVVRRPGSVVLLAPEDGEAVARHHCEAIAAGLNLSAEERRALEHGLHIIGGERPTNLLTDTAAIAALIAPVNPSLFIAEPLSSLIGGADENDERVASAVCESLRHDIARPLGTAILIAGHLRKPSREAGTSTAAEVADFKGSVGWSNHARMVWTVAKPKGGDLISLRLVKSNRLPTGIEHQVTLAIEADPDNQAHWLSCRLTDANIGATSVDLTPGVGRAINPNERRVLDSVYDETEPGRRVSRSESIKLSGLNPNTWKSVKNRLVPAGLMDASPIGENRNGKGKIYNYGITERGLQARKTGWADTLSRGEGVKG
jgi:hypothetical protein